MPNVPSLPTRSRDIVPALSRTLSSAIANLEPTRYSGGDPDQPPLVMPGRGPTAAAKAEAIAELDAMERTPLLNERDLGMWLRPIVAARLPNGPANEDARNGMLAGIYFACRHLPKAVLREEVMDEAFRTWRFWPSPADVCALLERTAKPWTTRLADLRAVIAAPLYRPVVAVEGAPYVPAISTPEEIEARHRIEAEHAARKLRAAPPPAAPIAPDILKAMRDSNPIVQAARREQADE